MILVAVFVAVSLLVEKDLVDSIINTTKWGVDSKVKFAAGIPLLVIGAGTLIMVYIMRRHRKVLRHLEDELERLDLSFRDLVHPKGLSGSILLRVFLAIIAMVALDLGVLVGIHRMADPQYRSGCTGASSCQLQLSSMGRLFARQYPKWNDFMTLRAERDPKNIFLTEYWQKHLGITTAA